MTATYLAWILILASSDGAFTKVENIATWEDCERLRKRVEASSVDKWRRASLAGSCTQVSILVEKAPEAKAPIVNVQMPEQKPPVINNRVIIRKHAP